MNWRRLSLIPVSPAAAAACRLRVPDGGHVGLALSVLQQEKQLSYKNYQASFQKTRVQISATLRHPTGQLALLNPPPAATGAPALHPCCCRLPRSTSTICRKVQQAVAMSGCLAQYGNNGSLCVGIGNNPWAGGFIYVAGTFDSASWCRTSAATRWSTRRTACG
jgi:hypothetical protein